MKPEMYLKGTSNFFIDQLQSKTQSQVNSWLCKPLMIQPVRHSPVRPTLPSSEGVLWHLKMYWELICGVSIPGFPGWLSQICSKSVSGDVTEITFQKVSQNLRTVNSPVSLPRAQGNSNRKAANTSLFSFTVLFCKQLCCWLCAASYMLYFTLIYTARSILKFFYLWTFTASPVSLGAILYGHIALKLISCS